ncbi:TSC22 domain family protein 2-like [Cololabis saira]|uniref:TSC22 domain family protein 2-like n=1 Tax=Cololabis saira TaxID=129043 RepID=UPI002AD4F21F|nr:TSC22 domain family protein 2-like [Cololabis saira]
MSKMPAKKKSCFQITSVTQAQVAAGGAADDTESLDDPDESRTEDVSSEIYDVSRAEYEPVCDRSSSEGEAEAPAPAPLAGEPAGVSGSVGGAAAAPLVGVGLPAPSPQPAAAASTAAPPATSTCSSRFRVIKLDHGTGEPFRRGRWTCTEFYERDSEAGRTADSIRHGSVTLDPAADRESGPGLPGGSAVPLATHSGLGSTAEASHLSTRLHSVETLSQQQPQQTLQQNFGAPQPGVGGSARAAPLNIKPTAAEGALQPPAAQNLLPVGQNGLSQPGVHLQKSPVMPPAAQPVPFPPQQQVAVGHHLASQTEYYQPQQSGPPLPLSSLSAGPGGQGPPSGPSQAGEGPGAGGGGVTAGLPAAAGGTGGPALAGGPAPPQQTVGQYAAAPGPPQPLGPPGSSGGQIVPAMAVSSSVLAAVSAAMLSASSSALPNATGFSLPPSRAPGALGALGGLPAAGFGQMEAGGRKSEGLINAQSPLVSGRDVVKPFMSETLQLSGPTVNSLFGIHIPVDGEEDSASGTNIVAIDNKIEQAMDLVKSHLMYAVREEVEVLKEQIKELYERNSVLEKENAVLKSLANSEQLSQLSPPPPAASSGAAPPPSAAAAAGAAAAPPAPAPPQTPAAPAAPAAPAGAGPAAAAQRHLRLKCISN